MDHFPFPPAAATIAMIDVRADSDKDDHALRTLRKLGSGWGFSSPTADKHAVSASLDDCKVLELLVVAVAGS